MIKFICPDDSFCLPALHAVCHDHDGRRNARVMKKNGSLYEFEIKAFQLLEAGKV